MVLGKLFEVILQVADPCGKQRDLNFGRTGIGFRSTEFRDDLSLHLFCQHLYVNSFINSKLSYRTVLSTPPWPTLDAGEDEPVNVRNSSSTIAIIFLSDLSAMTSVVSYTPGGGRSCTNEPIGKRRGYSLFLEGIWAKSTE
eukprot:Anaeramoba_flamelloidesa330576_19.p3 GENE.a330576_19~~a330576_19.p3  ORF type:complete len:141 (+),score=7.95 a330576_19:1100-1522(+)